jgi:hypothetical protein
MLHDSDHKRAIQSLDLRLGDAPFGCDESSSLTLTSEPVRDVGGDNELQIS